MLTELNRLGTKRFASRTFMKIRNVLLKNIATKSLNSDGIAELPKKDTFAFDLNYHMKYTKLEQQRNASPTRKTVRRSGSRSSTRNWKKKRTNKRGR